VYFPPDGTVNAAEAGRARHESLFSLNNGVYGTSL
jgi:hypothetical protein